MGSLRGIHHGDRVSTRAAKEAAYRDMADYYKSIGKSVIYTVYSKAMQPVRKAIYEEASEIAKEYIKKYQ
ncbi:MAG: hypothetical protein J6U04_06380 [Salinivirgaceae bacterium]|nr:hypothetical protein [Salinivirgaceae bacterium]